MDKITRMLILYSSLMNGEEINKTIFCFENDCSPRSFDRDIEDIRLFLSESFSALEVDYNRKNNAYYIKNAKKQQLEVMEYLFIEKILQDTSVLRNDEFTVLRHHLLMNTRDFSKTITSHNRAGNLYKSPEHNKALLKIYGDLELAIRNQKYIRMAYQDVNGEKSVCDVIPCSIKYNAGHLCFYGSIDAGSKTINIELERIYSFEILRGQSIDEKEIVDTYIRSSTDNAFLELYKDLVDVIIECSSNDYESLKKEFDVKEILWQGKGLLKIRLNVGEDAFIYWYLTFGSKNITIIEPAHIKDRLVSQAQRIIKQYGGRN